ncbi:hypothetical protein RHGRI_010293 [Rhododendron griersonianum]|uniref:Uncharacterized protein n=1 Tax=Rhododendron griersonianum TaxID=479676 RepID=A0AAV6KHY4_9ERIC|nr:hypothetical protein RHGRI_010293 [Rhododendron griersonianum]
MAFGLDQLDNEENPNNQRVLESYIHWYNASTAVSAVVAITAIVYIQDHLGWQVGFAVPAFLMVFSALVFFTGSFLYIKVKAGKSLLVGFVQVLVSSIQTPERQSPSQSL